MKSSAPSASADNSPTLTAHATQMGMIIGTAAYMAPEQARGKSVDRRADIWAFGVVLCEMLTGRRAFEGEEISDVLAAVLTRDPDLAALPSRTPASVRRLLERCLDKDPRRRLRDIGEARLQLDNTIAGRPDTSSISTPVATTIAPPPSRALWLAMPIVAIAAAAATWVLKPTTPAPATRLAIALPPGDQVTSVPAISRDGRVVAYAAGRTAATSQLYLRTLEDFAPRAVADSTGAQYPFFSPDGRSVAFFSGGKLRRAPVVGGAATAIAPAPVPWGGTWGDDGRIVYIPSFVGGLSRVSADGGAPEELTKPDGAAAGYAHVFPQRLPGTSDLLFSIWGQEFYTAVLSAKTGTWRKVTIATTSYAASATGTFAASGHVLTGDGTGGVRAAAWNPAIGTPVRPEAVVLDNVYWAASTGRTWINVAENGTSVFVPGNPSNRHVVWVDRQGRMTPIPGEAGLVIQTAASRDGRRVAYGGEHTLWIVDLSTGARTRIFSDVSAFHGGWLPGDERIVVSSNVSGDWDLYTIGTGGNSELKPLLKKPFAQHPMDVAPDGTVVFMGTNPATGADLWTLMRWPRVAARRDAVQRERGTGLGGWPVRRLRL